MATPAYLTGGFFGAIFAHRALIAQLTEREVVGRYRGSFLGLLWPFITPLLMLALYTLVFGSVFGGRHWAGGGDGSIGQYAIIIFVGLTLHGLLAEMLTQCPKLIRQNRNYVKRVMFPLDILPVVTLGGALFHASIGFMMLLVAQFAMSGRLPLTFVLLPVVLAPFALFALGVGWFLASLGVFIRDIDQTLRPVTSALLFLSPIFYPLSKLPDPLHHLLYLNPLTFIVEQSRAVLIWGEMPNWFVLTLYGVIAFVVAALGFWWFQKTRKGFADVL